MHEYVDCLRDAEIALTEQEIVALSLGADANGDGCIDYEEFMKHFNDVLHMVRFQHAVQAAMIELERKKPTLGKRLAP